MNWIECEKIYIPDDSPQGRTAIFVNTYTGVGGANNTWITSDVSSLVPADAKAIHVNGILIITHGTTAETADLHLHIRTDPTANPAYNGQVIEATVGNGIRSTMACWIALDANKCFQYKYTIPNPPPKVYPTYSAYGINLSIDAYAA
jgi:hypothetical protein